MRIQHNITAMNAYRNYTNNTNAIGKNLEKLSSGYKINRAGDDAAGLAVSQKMRLQIAGLAQAQKNAKSGISYVQTAEGALQEVHQMLERMYTLAEQSANGTYDDDTDRVQLQKELNQLREEIDRIGKTANFNGQGIFTQYVGGVDNDTTPPLEFTANTASLPAAITGVNVSTASGAATGAVVVSYTQVSADATATAGLSLTSSSLTFSAGTAGSAANGFTIVLNYAGTAATGNTAAASVSGDTITVTIKASATAADATGANILDAVSSALAGVTFGGVTGISVTGTIIASEFTGVTVGEDVGSASLAGGANSGDVVFTVDRGGTTGTVTISAGAWTGTAVAVSDPTLGVSFTVDSTNTGWTGSAVTLGTVAPEQQEATGAGNVSFWIGAENIKDGTTPVNKLSVNGLSLSSASMTVSGTTVPEGSITGVDISTADKAMASLDAIKKASDAISDMRGTLGAMQNRLEHTINNLSVMEENMQDAESVIRDTDIAQEMMAYTKNSILVQSAQAMLAQANQLPQGVLQLLQ